MKWTLKQMTRLGFSQPQSLESVNKSSSKKAPRHSFDIQNKWKAKDFRDPVAESKLARPKTDVH